VDVLAVVIVVQHVSARMIICKAHALHVIICYCAPAFSIDALASR